MSEGVVNRNHNYQSVDRSLLQPLNIQHHSSKSDLLLNDPRSSSSFNFDSSSGQSHFQSNAANNTSPQSIDWQHDNHSTFSQIAHNDPVDPNVVVIPKHPNYISKLFRPDRKTIASEEGFATLRVETLALCCLFIITAAIFSPDYAPFIVLLVVGAVLCLIGFFGALREIKQLIHFYLMGLILWVLVIITLAFTVLFVTDTMMDDATDRCYLNKNYFMKFGQTPFGPLDCNTNSWQCFQQCIVQVRRHLRISYFVFGGLICIFLSVYFFRMINILKILLFPTPTESQPEESFSTDNLDDDDDDMMVNNAGLQQGQHSPNVGASQIGGRGVQLVSPPTITTTQSTNAQQYPPSPSSQSQTRNVRFSSRVDGDDIVLTSQNPLHNS